MFRAMSTIGFVALIAQATVLHAAVVIGGTRVVFPAKDRDVSLRIENKGSDPALVQAWIDDGDERSTPSSATAPFAITPPVFRIDPGHGHALRIVHVGDEAPRDREALYWLNVLEIPPKAAETDGKNVLQLAFRHRLKIFHRPAELSVSPERAATMLTWSLDNDGEAPRLRVENPSPYHVSFNAVDLHARETGHAPLSLGGGMVKPGGSTSFAWPKGQPRFEAARVAFVSINDFGAAISGSAMLGP